MPNKPLQTLHFPHVILCFDLLILYIYIYIYIGPETAELAKLREYANHVPKHKIISFNDIKTISCLYRKYFSSPSSSSSSPTKNKTNSICGNGFIHELLQDNEPILHSPSQPKNSPAFEAYLERMKVKQNQRETNALLGRSTVDQVEFGVGNTLTEVGMGINIIALMATGFVVFYYGGRQYFGPHDQLAPVLCGLFGLIAAMMLEIILFMLRYQQSRIGAKLKKNRDAKEQKQALQRAQNRAKAANSNKI